MNMQSYFQKSEQTLKSPLWFALPQPHYVTIEIEENQG